MGLDGLGAIFTPLSGSVPELKLYWDSHLTDNDNFLFPSQQQASAATGGTAGGAATTTPTRPLGSSGQVRIGRGPAPRYNDIMLPAKRISNRHCLITRLDDPGSDDASPWLSNNNNNNNSSSTTRNRSRPSQEPVVLIEDLNSSNGTFVNSHRITRKQVLRHGDEVSLGSNGPVPSMGHDVRWIYKSVGWLGVGDEERVGEIFERFHFEQT